MKKNVEIAVYSFGGLVAIAGVYFLVKDMNKRLKAVKYAQTFLDEKEKSGNLGFQDPKFEALMKNVGWQKGQAWCNYFTKVIWVNQFKKDKDLIAKLMNGSTQGTYKNFVNDTSGKFEVSKTAKPGDIVIWQKFVSGKASSFGHAGIVLKPGKDEFETIEGNTNKAGGREGDTVAKKTRKYNFNKTSGLRLKGFIHYKG